jgi:hypothetical protein
MQMTADNDPLARKAHADLVMDRTAQQLRDLLHATVAAVDPFPPFEGSFFNYAIEIEPGIVANKNRGCIVVGRDGEIYEMIMRIDVSGDDMDAVASRDEEMRELSLSKEEYIILAYNAIQAVVDYQLKHSS